MIQVQNIKKVICLKSKYVGIIRIQFYIINLNLFYE